ncbi:MAG: YybH family protein [Chitinophagales bacterium]
MKQLLILLFLAISIVGFSQSNDEIAVRKLLNDQQVSWNRGDIDGFMKGYWKGDSLTFTGKSGITYGWTKTLANYKRNYPDTVAMGKLEFTVITANTLTAEYFHVIGKWQLRRSIGNLEGYFTLLFRKINGQWLIIADHTS